MKKGEQTRQDIVGQALLMASEVGLEGLSLGTLASALQLSKSGLFAHFKSKEQLQLDVVQEGIERFTRVVVLPALSKPPGPPRLTALFENHLRWIRGQAGAGRGCIFMSFSQEFDDRPGPVRELLAQSQRTWRDTIARVVKSGVDAGAFSTANLSAAQFATELVGIGMSLQQGLRLLEDPRAEAFARAAFHALVARLTPPARA